MNNKYIDIPSTIQVIGNTYNNPSLLDDTNYSFTEEDFTEQFHKILFGAIYNLHKLGVQQITINTIEDYLQQRPTSLGIYKANNGAEYLQKISQNVQIASFDYYYKRLKKMTLLRMYDSIGLDLTWIYDVNNILDAKKKQAQEDWLDNTSIEDIAETIDRKITEIRLRYAENGNDDFTPVGQGILEVIEKYKKTPDLGYPLFGRYINAITRGARFGKFYLRSAATGVGKTRSMVADACNIGCDKIYNPITQTWDDNGNKEPVLYIATEQDLTEIQTMMLAFLSCVNEEHILSNSYLPGELERVMYAGNLLKKCPIIIKALPDFSLKDIENTIKTSIIKHRTKYIFFDYIHTSMKILGEVTSKTGIKGLREDNVLFMMSTKLKDLCTQYGVFIMSSTQLNADYREARIYDQNLLRGAKAIADRIDCGMIMLQTDKEDLENLKPIIAKEGFPQPEIKISVYKNRASSFKDVLLWCKADRGTCRIEPLFVTDYQYKLIQIKDVKITINPDLIASAF